MHAHDQRPSQCIQSGLMDVMRLTHLVILDVNVEVFVALGIQIVR